MFYGGFVFLEKVFYGKEIFVYRSVFFCQPVGVSFENFFDFLSVIGSIANF